MSTNKTDHKIYKCCYCSDNKPCYCITDINIKNLRCIESGGWSYWEEGVKVIEIEEILSNIKRGR